jgi:hypothetical protein
MIRASLLLALALGCTRQEAPRPLPAAPVAAPAQHPVDALNAIDTRRPVPLLPMMANHQKQNMRDHLVAVQEVVAALAADDMPAAQRASQRIGFSEPMGRMCSHMGMGAPGFTAQATNFHHTADRIGEAAARGDRPGVLRALNDTLLTCTGCHTTWRQEVVDDAEWRRRTAAAPPTHGH